MQRQDTVDADARQAEAMVALARGLLPRLAGASDPTPIGRAGMPAACLSL